MNRWGQEEHPCKAMLVPVEFPFLLDGYPPLCAGIKARPEDFVVEEVLGHEPCGEGDYLYLFVEKRNLSMEQLVAVVRATTGASQVVVGYAGLKDKAAITRQWISLPAEFSTAPDAVRSSQVRVLKFARHGSPLKIGKLSGNRFDILLRGASPKAAGQVADAVLALARRGMANLYGPQRFGRDYEAPRVGLDVALGRMDASGMSRLKRRFVVSAVQAHLFNRYCLERHKYVGLNRAVPGDILKGAGTGGELERTREPAKAQARIDAGDAVITGPMYGRKLMRADDRAGVMEGEILSMHSLDFQSFDGFYRLGAGSRRPLLVRPTDISVEPAPDGIRLRFFLPAGSFATTLLRELLRRTVR